ncbi:MAG: response regulator [Bacteroidaceae bacterium]|nr:response regulator [Bacteroidaceae bacterium]
MKQTKLLMACCVFACTLRVAWGQDPDMYVSELNGMGKLPVNEVTAIAQDYDGYMWYGTSDGLCRDDGYDIKVVRSDFHTPDVLERNRINNIAVDRKGHVWLSTRKGVYILDKETFKTRRIENPDLAESAYVLLIHTQDDRVWIGGSSCAYEFGSDGSLIKKWPLNAGVAMFYEDSKGRLFISVYGDGLYCKSAKGKELVKIADGRVPSCMTEDATREGSYFVCQDGVTKMTLNGEKADFTPLPMPKDEAGHDVPFIIRIVQDDHSHNVWLMSYYRGIMVLDPSGRQLELNEQLKRYNTPTMNCLYKDLAGRLWISGFNSGCQNICWSEKGIRNIDMTSLIRQTSMVPTIMQLTKDDGDVMWMHQDRKGLYLYDATRKTFSYYYEFPELRNLELYQIKCITPAEELNTMWIAYYGNRIVRLTRHAMELTLQETIDLSDYTHTSGEIECMLDDRNGHLWIGTQNGLYRYDRNDGKMTLIPATENEIAAIIPANGQGIWFATKDGGLMRLRESDAEEVTTVSGINSIAEDGQGHLWIASIHGNVLEYDTNRRTMTDHTSTCGLEGNSINDIFVDRQQQVWMVSNQQINIYNKETGAQRLISTADEQIILNRLLPHACFYDRKTNSFCFGGIPGVMTVSAQMPLDPSRQNVYITDIHSDNNSIWFDSLRRGDEFLINPDDQNIEISFSTLNILHTATTRYAYRMVGLSDKWIELKAGKNEAIYNNLPKGHYVFEVRAMNENGMWDEHATQLKIYRKPAWYETNWAYFAYLLMAVMAILSLARLYQLRMKKRNAQQLQEQIVQTKIGYFTNISHELLTPLAVISSINESYSPTDESEQQKKQLIQSNITRLKLLLQQILDFRKIETGNIKLYVENGNLSQLVESRCRESFTPLAQSKNIQISIEKPLEDINGYFDIDKIDKILFNLVSNAIKYSPEGKNVTIRLAKILQAANKHEMATIAVADQGIGIAASETGKVFKRFYTHKGTSGVESNGIGLSLSKDLIEIHHGTIALQSQYGHGATFTITFPIDRAAYTPNEIKDRKQDEQIGLLQQEISQMHIKQHPATDLSLIVVEDNIDMLTALEALLSKQYYTYTATNGYEALELLKQHPEVQFIVSDISMPDMDGLTLCQRIKGDINTSHIIVVMLTAMVSSEKQIASYDAGADAYLAKPFESKVLNAMLTNLWNQRLARQKAFRSNPDSMSTNELEVTDIDREFIDKLILIVQQNISSPLLDVEFLASQLCMSRSTLSRKLRAVTGDTPLEFIKTVKLKHAYVLLKRRRMSVIEVVEAIGYNDRQTFTRSFKEMFGVLPREV